MKAVAVAVALVASLGLAACGGGDDRLSKQEFLEEANAIVCKGGAEVQEENGRVFGDGSTTPTNEQILAFVDFEVAHDRRTFDAVAELKGPENLDEAVDDLANDSKEALRTFRARMRQDPTAIDAVEQEIFAPLRERASKLGLGPEHCG